MTRVVDRELLYRADKDGIRSKAVRRRMPWKEYRAIVLADLPVSCGYFELRDILTIRRRNKEVAGRWLQRLEVCKNSAEDVKLMLPDALYVNLATRVFMAEEIKSLAKIVTQKVDGEEMTEGQKMIAISELSWKKLRKLVSTNLDSAMKE